MLVERRQVLALGAAATFAGVARAGAAQPMTMTGLDAVPIGLNPGSPDDQSRALQRALDEAAAKDVPLALAPGVYRVGGLRLPARTQIIGVRGATKLVFSNGPSLIDTEHADRVTLWGLVFDGVNLPLPARRGLVHIANARGVEISDCEFRNAGGNALQLLAAEGSVSGNLFAGASEAAIHSDDAIGLLIAGNTISSAGDNGIQIWRAQAGDDGSIVTDNRIENISNRSGGSGQNGNAINVFRAANVIVRGNRIKTCAFSAVRGNAASNLQIEGNSVTDTREVALYAEFGFEGAVIANNSVDGAAIGVSVTNFNEGGRLAVVEGNIIRNLYAQRPVGTVSGDGAGIGIAVEAEAAVTGNVVENAPLAGIALGYGRYLRDVAATGNVVRRADIGIAVSVAAGAGTALIANNVISETQSGAIIGMDRQKIVTGDLMKGGAERYVQLTLSGNRAS
jgi:uncharacterized secreted repeat protein (TIGR03808 family)